jgi:tetratricopeptide (TPR) repeat protein
MDKPDKISPAKLDEILSQWSLPPIPPRLRPITKKYQDRKLNLKDLGNWVREELTQTQDTVKREKIELATLDWLYEFIRGNVKRGRVFELDQVVNQRIADCLGYVKMFQLLGKEFGLDIGIVEVVIDNAGRYVPHPISILRLAGKRYQFIDPWYGSKDISHQRIGAQVREKGKWLIKDVNRDELEKLTDVKGLPTGCVDAITYYIIGNRHLEQGIHYSDEKELRKAIDTYDKAIKLYPQNARFYFNRAVAYENIGEKEKAAGDYAQALKDEASQIRVLAREYEESTQLIELDQRDISLQKQEIYLLRKGFSTGKENSAEDVASQYGISAEEVERIISEIEAKFSY